MLAPGFVGEQRFTVGCSILSPEMRAVSLALIAPSWLRLGQQPEGQLALRKIMYCKFTNTTAPLCFGMQVDSRCPSLFPWGRWAQGFLHPCRIWLFISLCAALAFGVFISLSQCLAKNGKS